MPGVDFDTLAAVKTQLIRKALQSAVWFADTTVSVPVDGTIFGTDGTITLPTGYKPVGAVTKSDAITWGRAVDKSDVTSLGFVEPTRSDITKSTSTVKFTAQQTHKPVLEAYFGLDLSSVVADPTTKTVAFAEPARPATRYYRCLGIAKDGAGTSTIYIGTLFARANVTNMEDLKWTDGDDAIAYGITLQSYVDSVLGYGIRHYFGGPGWAAILTDTGFS